ncbi:hypothetical protein [Streptomyces sp. NPDC008092]|uniref:hypothetical protein n=1 Tax=Streptomyces sp. NPDC008092 TaxID=3364808 RepID=UPI0036E32126
MRQHQAGTTPARKPPRTAPRPAPAARRASVARPASVPRPAPAPALGAWERSRRLGLREVRGPTAATAVAVHTEPPRRAARDLEAERAEPLCTGHKTSLT